MNRRSFLSHTLLSSGLVGLTQAVPAHAEAVCKPELGFVSAEARYHAAYEHYHLLSIPIEALISLPAEGFQTRTAVLDAESFDNEAFAKTGLPDTLRTHSHAVNFSQDILKRIADGEQNVEVVVTTPKGNLGHKFFFTASKAALAKIKKGRG